MWEKLLSIASTLLQISSVLVENRREIDSLQEQVTDLRSDMKLLTQKLEHFSETERNHHRQNLLELEVRILQMEKRLPPASDN